MEEVARYVIPVRAGRSVRSLSWQGDDLVDWASWGVRYRLDGTIDDPHRTLGHRFDAAIALPDGRYAVAYDRLGTKGVILRDGEIVRQINRDFYCSEAYEYPVALLTLPDGRDAIIHCPDEYRKLEVEEIESGKRLTERGGAPLDFFHSRLQVSPAGRFLLSAGWIWHPLDTIQVYDLCRALSEPEILDRNERGHPIGIDGVRGMDEIHSAAFAGEDLLVVAGNNYYKDDDQKPFIGEYCIGENRLRSSVSMTEDAGTLMPLGDLVVGCFEHPKLINSRTGEIIYRWLDIASGSQTSSITRGVDCLPPVALDPANKQFAVAGEAAITVVQLE